jgi:hypothetical protein
MKQKQVACFQLQATKSFPDGAPQRENAHSDEHFYRVCRKYAAEWVMEYKHPGSCRNRDCPQCFRDEMP